MELKPTPTAPNQIVSFSVANLGMTIIEAEQYSRNCAEAALDASEARKRLASGLLSKASKVAEWIEDAAGDNPAEAVKQYLAALSAVSPVLSPRQQSDNVTSNHSINSVNIFSEDQARSILSAMRTPPAKTENRHNHAEKIIEG